MKYSQEIQNEICQYLEEGMSQKDAADLAGISKATFQRWKNENETFETAIKKAGMRCKRRNIGIIQKAAITTWQAAAWWLERRFKNEYALKHKIEGTIEGKVELKLSKLGQKMYKQAIEYAKGKKQAAKNSSNEGGKQK